MFSELGHWIAIKDGDPRAFALYQRHYSYKHNAHKVREERHKYKIVGPSRYLMLMTQACDALFLWVYPLPGMRRDGQQGINCALFRNESRILSSALILEAESLAYAKWGHQRLYTFVDTAEIASRNPGYCYKMAGWQACGVTKRHKLVILEKGGD